MDVIRGFPLACLEMAALALSDRAMRAMGGFKSRNQPTESGGVLGLLVPSLF